MSSRKQNILIVGGGAAAVTVAKDLSKALDPAGFTLQMVTDRPYHIHYPALLRVVVTAEGSLEKSALNPFDRIFAPGKVGEVIVGSVHHVEDGVAHLEDGRTLAYDYFILATGTMWNGPLAFPTSAEKKNAWISTWREQFANANDVVIIGGGANGIELAGELRYYHPGHKVTVVHPEAYLLNDAYPVKFRAYLTKKALALGIELVLGDRAKMPVEPYTSVTTEKGRKITTDLVIPMWGGHVNTAFLSTFDPTILTPKGTVRVLPTLRVPLASGKENVYALGDIIEWDEQKQLSKVTTMAGVVVPNILATIKGTPVKAEYKGFMEAIVIPLGPKGGAGYLPLLWGITIGDWFTWFLKSKTLFVSNAQKLMGYA